MIIGIPAITGGERYGKQRTDRGGLIMAPDKVLILGSSGMLGSMVFGYLSRQRSLDVTGSVRDKKLLGPRQIYFDAEEIARERNGGDALARYDYIINCIGVIKPYCKDNDPASLKRAIIINSLFPHVLGELSRKYGLRTIQIATDCVYSGAKGSYAEDDPHDALDVYGKSKSLGEVFDGSMLNIRCSIIGPEKKSKLSLLEWFFAQPDGGNVKGFVHHEWNGVTTLQFAKLCERIIQGGDTYAKLLSVSPVHHFAPNSTITKYELLNLFARYFDKKVSIERIYESGCAVKRTLTSKHSLLRELYGEQPMETAIAELKEYIDKKLY
jgi:dTDP-4-dehydrorhamnose reductase